MHPFFTSLSVLSGAGTAKYMFAWRLSKQKKDSEKDVKQKEFVNSFVACFQQQARLDDIVRLLLAWILQLHCHCFLVPDRLKPIYQHRNRTPGVCVEKLICASSFEQALPAIYLSAFAQSCTHLQEKWCQTATSNPISRDSHTTELHSEGERTGRIWQLQLTAIQYPTNAINLSSSDTCWCQEFQPWAEHKDRLDAEEITGKNWIGRSGTASLSCSGCLQSMINLQEQIFRWSYS